MEALLHPLKIKLQSLGALRPEAWEAIVLAMGHTALKVDESLIRKEGTLAYIAKGLLKEYDAQNRKKPAIVNFISEGESLVTRTYNQKQYIKTNLPTIIFYWEAEQLENLYRDFKELKSIYDALCGAYDSQVLFRMRLLEMPVRERISAFQQHFGAALPYLKKKDIANYLHLNYSHFVKNYNLFL